MKIKANFKNEKNGNSKLTDEQVEAIRQLAQTSYVTYRQLGAMFNCSHTHARRIVLDQARA
jgi:predicted HTH transcriptional regulator